MELAIASFSCSPSKAAGDNAAVVMAVKEAETEQADMPNGRATASTQSSKQQLPQGQTQLWSHAEEGAWSGVQAADTTRRRSSSSHSQ
jgi:hypothetical protein